MSYYSQGLLSTIRHIYGNRCAICLNLLPEVSIQSVHLIDSAAVCAEQVCLVEISCQASQETNHVPQLDTVVDFGILNSDYRRTVINGMTRKSDKSSPSVRNILLTADAVRMSDLPPKLLCSWYHRPFSLLARPEVHS